MYLIPLILVCPPHYVYYSIHRHFFCGLIFCLFLYCSNPQCHLSAPSTGEASKDPGHISLVARVQEGFLVDIVAVGVVVVHHSINILQDEVAEGSFSLAGSPGVGGEARYMLTECHVEGFWNPAVVPHVVVKFSAAWRGCTSINSGGNGRSGEGLCAQDTFIVKELVLVANDDANSARDSALMGRSFIIHPSIRKASTLVGEGGFERW